MEKDKEGSSDEICANVFSETTTLMETIREFCVQVQKQKRNVSLERVYHSFRVLRSAAINLCDIGTRQKVVFNDVTCFKSLTQSLVAFEHMRVARDYPTPRTARNTYKVRPGLRVKIEREGRESDSRHSLSCDHCCVLVIARSVRVLRK
jgi:hypothetical protein